jgi:hypothetical protein
MMSSIVTLNVSGTMFYAPKSVLIRSPFLRQKLQTDHTTLHIDQDAEAFEHVLYLLRDPTYPFPNPWKHELSIYEIGQVACPCPDPATSFLAHKTHNHMLLSTFETLSSDHKQAYEGLIQLVPPRETLKATGCRKHATGETCIVLAEPHAGMPIQMCWNTVILLQKPRKMKEVGHAMLYQMLKRFDVFLTSVLVPKKVSTSYHAALLVVDVPAHTRQFL